MKFLNFPLFVFKKLLYKNQQDFLVILIQFIIKMIFFLSQDLSFYSSIVL